MKVYGLPEGQGLEGPNDMARATGSPYTFIMSKAKIFIALSAMNSCSVIMR